MRGESNKSGSDGAHKHSLLSSNSSEVKVLLKMRSVALAAAAGHSSDLCEFGPDLFAVAGQRAPEHGADASDDLYAAFY